MSVAITVMAAFGFIFTREDKFAGVNCQACFFHNLSDDCLPGCFVFLYSAARKIV